MGLLVLAASPAVLYSFMFLHFGENPCIATIKTMTIVRTLDESFIALLKLLYLNTKSILSDFDSFMFVSHTY